MVLRVMRKMQFMNYSTSYCKTNKLINDILWVTIKIHIFSFKHGDPYSGCTPAYLSF